MMKNLHLIMHYSSKCRPVELMSYLISFLCKKKKKLVGLFINDKKYNNLVNS